MPVGDQWLTEEPYRPRPTRMYRLIEPSGWVLKLYGVSYSWSAVDEQLLTAAADAAGAVVTSLDPTDTFGVGFVIAHQGQHAEWVLVHWWQTGGILAHRLLSRPPGSTDPLTLAAPQLVGCVWELPVINFERDCWVSHVLVDPSRPDLTGYLAAALTAEAD